MTGHLDSAKKKKKNWPIFEAGTEYKRKGRKYQHHSDTVLML